MQTNSKTLLLITILSVFILYSCTDESIEEFDRIKNSQSIGVLDKFIQDFPDSDSLNAAVIIRDKLVFDSISKINTIQAYTQFISDYPDAKQVEIAKTMIKRRKRSRVVIGTFRGNFQRNYYGNKCPNRLDIIWTRNMGSGKSFAYGKMKTWSGAGWTGQPLVLIENKKTYLIQGCFDYNLKKIDASNGKVIWQYKFDDIIKGTGTIYVNNKAENPDERVVVMQGSRRGQIKSKHKGITPSFRAISYFSGKELWRMNSKKTPSFSRDVDGSAAVWGDTAYIALENGIFTVFDPNANNLEMRDGIKQPKLYDEKQLWNKDDIKKHRGNLVAESSPTIFNGRVYVASGSGHVYGYNLSTKSIDWDFYIGSDMDGSAPITNDSCMMVSVEKQYIKGKGGVFKLDPSKKEKDAVEWYFPVEDNECGNWHGGLIGTVAVNDKYIEPSDTHLAAFLAIDGYLYVVDHKSITKEQVLGPNKLKKYYKPKLVFKQKVGSSISSPIITENRIVACTYEGIYLFAYDENLNFKLLDKKQGMFFEASPICWDKKIYIVSKGGGLMYCFGEK